MRHLVAEAAFFAQCQPLLHAETVLLVDDDQPQALEHHRVLEQGVGAHHQGAAAFGQGRQGLPARLGADAAGQPVHVDAQRRQPVAEIGQVLLGEQFRGRHQRHLVAGFDRHQGGGGGHQGFAGAHVPLDQAQHRVLAGQVGADLPDHPLLGAGELERQRLEQLAGEGLAAQHRRRQRLLAGPFGQHAQLVGDHLFHHQALHRRVIAVQQQVHRVVRLRVMQLGEGLGQAGQAALIQQLPGDQLFRRMGL